MRVAIVGATGLIGSAVAKALAARGDEVVAVVRRHAEIDAASTEVVWDPAAGPVPPDAFAGCDAVLNFAGATIGRRWNDQVKREIETSRIDVTRQIVEAIGSDGPRTLVNASAVGFYGNRDEPVDEASPAGSGFLADVCVKWEAAAREAEANGVRVVLMRNGVVMSTDGGALPQILTPARLGVSGPVAGGRQWFPWVHLADAVGAVLWVLDHDEISGPVNVVAPNIVRQGDFAKTLGAVLHRPAFTPTPGFAIRLMLGEGAVIVTEGQNVVPRVIRDSGYRFAFPDLEPALEDLLPQDE